MPAGSPQQIRSSRCVFISIFSWTTTQMFCANSAQTMCWVRFLAYGMYQKRGDRAVRATNKRRLKKPIKSDAIHIGTLNIIYTGNPFLGMFGFSLPLFCRTIVEPAAHDVRRAIKMTKNSRYDVYPLLIHWFTLCTRLETWRSSRFFSLATPIASRPGLHPFTPAVPALLVLSISWPCGSTHQHSNESNRWIHCSGR